MALEAPPGGGQLSAACVGWSLSPRPERCWPPKFGLGSQRLGAGWLTGQPSWDRTGPCSRGWGTAWVSGLTPRCAALGLLAGGAGSYWYEWRLGASWWNPGPGWDVSS